MQKDKLLTDIFRAYYNARQYKRNETSALQFEADFERHLVDLCEDIALRRYHVGRSTCFIVTKPVRREIFAADFRDRVVHHLIFSYIAPLFERVFIEDSYSCRKGRGTLYGVNRIAHHLRSCTENFTKDAYVLKLDIQGYFMNINRQMLYDRVVGMMRKMASRKVDRRSEITWGEQLDYDLLEYLLAEIIFADPTIDCIIKGSTRDWMGLPANKSLFGTPRDCGLPIGNLTSQLFSNIYLSDFDNYCKRELKLKHYGRYVDDFVIIHPDQKYLESLIPILDRYLESEFALKLHPKKIYLQHYSKGVTFLGVTIKGAAIFPGKRMRKAAFAVVHHANHAAKNWTAYDMYRTPEFVELFVQRVNSYLGQMLHCQGAKAREELVGAFSPQLRWWVAPHRPKVVVRANQNGGMDLVQSSANKVAIVHKNR